MDNLLIEYYKKKKYREDLHKLIPNPIRTRENYGDFSVHFLAQNLSKIGDMDRPNFFFYCLFYESFFQTHHSSWDRGEKLKDGLNYPKFNVGGHWYCDVCSIIGFGVASEIAFDCYRATDFENFKEFSKHFYEKVWFKSIKKKYVKHRKIIEQMIKDFLEEIKQRNRQILRTNIIDENPSVYKQIFYNSEKLLNKIKEKENKKTIIKQYKQFWQVVCDDLMQYSVYGDQIT